MYKIKPNQTVRIISNFNIFSQPLPNLLQQPPQNIPLRQSHRRISLHLQKNTSINLHHKLRHGLNLYL